MSIEYNRTIYKVNEIIRLVVLLMCCITAAFMLYGDIYLLGHEFISVGVRISHILFLVGTIIMIVQSMKQVNKIKLASIALGLYVAALILFPKGHCFILFGILLCGLEIHHAKYMI